MDTTQLIHLIVGSVGSLFFGWMTKRYTAVPNGLIPLINGTLFTVAFATLGKMGFTYEAVITGITAAYTATAAYEAAKVPLKKSGAVGVFAALTALLVAGFASADEGTSWVPEIKPYGGPTFFATAYSDNEALQDPADSPHFRARTGFRTPITREYQVVGPVLWRPEAAFVWRAQRWPVGAESSPITESIYQPEAFVALAPGDEIRLGPFELEGGQIGWMHQSNGTDSLSASWDRVTFEGTLAYEGWLRVSARGWYVLATGMDTDGMLDWANFGFWRDAGGELSLEALFDFAKLRGTLGLTSQDVEAAIPFADFWAASLLLWMHHGEMGSLVDYRSAETVGGAGVGFFY